MTQRSMWWNTNGVGHGVFSGYAQDRWENMLRKLFQTGVLIGIDNQLAVSSGANNQVSIATGAAVVYGYVYENTATETINLTAVAGTTGGRVVLRASWASQTVSLTVIQNTDGNAAIPAAVQTPGTTFDLTLATYQLAASGTVTLTDARTYSRYSGRIEGGNLDANVADNSTIELVASTLRVKNAGSLPKLIGREGGSASDWNVAGTTDYTSFSSVAMQTGVEEWTADGFATGSTQIGITFPVAFGAPPNVIVGTVRNPVPASTVTVLNNLTTTTAAVIEIKFIGGGTPGAGQVYGFSWIALGPSA